MSDDDRSGAFKNWRPGTGIFDSSNRDRDEEKRDKYQQYRKILKNTYNKDIEGEKGDEEMIKSLGMADSELKEGHYEKAMGFALYAGKICYDHMGIVGKHEYSPLINKRIDRITKKALEKNEYKKLEKWVPEIKKFEREFKESKLEKTAKTAVIVSIVFLALAIFFLSSNVTGNVIGNMTNSTSNWIGGILFCLGLVGAFVYFKKK